MKVIAAAASALLALCSTAHAVDPNDTLLLAEPDISEHNIVFTYDGDIWLAGRDGGTARRLTTAEGQEVRPHFSPDGASIAFSGNYDGNVDVYLMPVAGGSPRRLTWHGADDLMEGFTPDGRVIFSSQREAQTFQQVHLYSVDPRETYPRRLPMPSGHDADVSADNTSIAYAIMPPNSLHALTQWKSYRGGSASRIAIMNLADLSLNKVPQPESRSNDLNPMWVAGKLYFNSDRDGEFNLYRYDAASNDVQRLTSYNDFPVVNANAGAGRIIYEQAGRLHVFDPTSGSDKVLRIAVNSDLRETRPRRVSKNEYVRSVAPSPTLDRVAIEYRGEIMTSPASKGAIRDITHSPGANDRSPVWSADGKRIAWFSDADGEYALHVRNADDTGATARVPIEGGSGFYTDLKWSPDGRRVSFLDNAYSLFVTDLETKRTRRLATNDYFGHSPFISHNWAPDSQWLAYTRNSNGLIQTVHVYSVTRNASTQITDGMTEVSEPVFDPNGRYLYVIASDDAGPVKDWFSQSSLDINLTHALYAIVLRKGDVSPLPAEDEVAAIQQDLPAADDREVEVTIDFDGIDERIVALPTGGATLRSLRAGKTGELYYLWTPATPALDSLNHGGELKRFTMKDRTARTLLGGVDAFQVSADGSRLLIRQGKVWKAAAADREIKPDAWTALPLEDISVEIDPGQEWRQILREAWRLNRDFFYATNYHGVDWPAILSKYEPFIDHAATRADVGRIVSMLASELRVGHSYSTPGESLDAPTNVNVGLLGADYEIDQGRYRFKKIFGGLNWRPELRAPLKVPGNAVSEGEYLLAVEGHPLTSTQSVFAAFQNLADRPVTLRVGPRPDEQGSRTIKVFPVSNERELRYVDWVESNIRKVDAATNGRVAYVHVPDTSVEGHASFKRYFYPQSHKDALILDARDNGGGYVADYYMEVLRQKPVIYWATRYGKDLRTPRAAIYGPKVMLSNEGAGSGGDLLPWMFQREHIGPVIGTRTWGGLVGNLNIHPLMDGSTITAPNIAGWTPDSGWVIENVGVAPDIEVEQTPKAVAEGRDPQLERAIEEALRALQAQPPRQPPRPTYPVRGEAPARP